MKLIAVLFLMITTVSAHGTVFDRRLPGEREKTGPVKNEKGLASSADRPTILREESSIDPKSTANRKLTNNSDTDIGVQYAAEDHIDPGFDRKDEDVSFMLEEMIELDEMLELFDPSQAQYIPYTILVNTCREGVKIGSLSVGKNDIRCDSYADLPSGESMYLFTDAGRHRYFSAYAPFDVSVNSTNNVVAEVPFTSFNQTHWTCDALAADNPWYEYGADDVITLCE